MPLLVRRMDGRTAKQRAAAILTRWPRRAPTHRPSQLPVASASARRWRAPCHPAAARVADDADRQPRRPSTPRRVRGHAGAQPRAGNEPWSSSPNDERLAALDQGADVVDGALIGEVLSPDKSGRRRPDDGLLKPDGQVSCRQFKELTGRMWRLSAPAALHVAIILCSIASVAIILARLWTCKSRVVPRDLAQKVWNWIEADQLSDKLVAP